MSRKYALPKSGTTVGCGGSVAKANDSELAKIRELFGMGKICEDTGSGDKLAGLHGELMVLRLLSPDIWMLDREKKHSTDVHRTSPA